MTKIFLDPGHGGSDPGATANGLREKDLTLKIARYTRDYLQGNYQDASIRMSRTGDTYPSLTARANDANRWGADLFVSIHINAHNGSAYGYEDFIYNGPVSNNTLKLQNTLHKELSRLFRNNRGKKRANFAVLRQTKMPAVLTECGFIDNKTDADLLKKESYLKDLGEAHAKGIAAYLGLKRKSQPKPKPKPSTNNSGGFYYVQIGAFSKKANADDLVRQAKSKGFDAFTKYENKLYKVQLGAFSNKNNAYDLANRAKRAGLNVFVAQ